MEKAAVLVCLPAQSLESEQAAAQVLKAVAHARSLVPVTEKPTACLSVILNPIINCVSRN